jgi:hypothetical protein
VAMVRHLEEMSSENRTHGAYVSRYLFLALILGNFVDGQDVCLVGKDK